MPFAPYRSLEIPQCNTYMRSVQWDGEVCSQLTPPWSVLWVVSTPTLHPKPGKREKYTLLETTVLLARKTHTYSTEKCTKINVDFWLEFCFQPVQRLCREVFSGVAEPSQYLSMQGRFHAGSYCTPPHWEDKSPSRTLSLSSTCVL